MKEIKKVDKKAILHEVIAMAWSDKVSFDSIEQETGLSEKRVIHIMRNNLKRSSFKLWRKRVSGRASKHKIKFGC